MDTDTNRTDIAAAIGKGVVGGFLPVVGALVAEVIGFLIPNQRMDRIVRLVKALEAKLAELDADRLKARFTDPGFVDLLEDGFWQASRALSDERIEHIAAALKNSLTEKQIGHVESKRLLQLLGELNDIEIIILCSHGLRGPEADRFHRKHKAVLTAPLASINASQEEIDKEALYKSHMDHLHRLGLLRHRFDLPPVEGVPEFDPHTGMLRATEHWITELGMLLLYHLDLVKRSDKSPKRKG